MHEAAPKRDELTPACRVYFFCKDATEGDPARTDILGGKGASLAAMSGAGLPVPPGFTISIACCRHYHENNGAWPDGLAEEVRASMTRLERATGKRFGAGARPLLVSVRSGAAYSMPGMMDTILNCGLCPELADQVADPEHFWSVYAHFIRQFAATVADVPESDVEGARAALGDRAASGKALAEAYMALYEHHAGKPFPTAPWEALCLCINAVFDSWNNERARVYRKAHGLGSLEGTAVTVQAMFDSQVSGIAFTANPTNPWAGEIVIESSYGLGESVVSGDVTPDRFILERSTLKLKEKVLGNKSFVMSGLARRHEGHASAWSLSDRQAVELARIALEVEHYFGHEVDIEWGLEDGRFALLQSRAVRGLEVSRDVEVGRREEIERLGKLAGAKGKVWVIHNLAETLRAPTPLTWDVMRRFMSGDGGFGLMYQDFGYRPSRRVRTDGFLELICAQVYSDPDRAAELFWEGLPFKYDHEEVLANPRILETAPVKFDADRADGAFLVRLPATLWAMMRCSRRMKKARVCAAERFDRDALPPFLDYVKEKRSQDWSRLSTRELLAELHQRVERVLIDFGKESLKPGFFGGCARAELERHLVRLMGPLEGQNLCQTLTSGLDNDSTVAQNAMLFDVSRGQASMDVFIERYGHRAVGEMELARPRWREDPSYLEQIVRRRPSGDEQSPASLHRKNEARRKETMEALPETLARWGGSFLLERIRILAAEAQALLPYRETSKHYLMMGYELVRAAAVELGRRWDLGDDVFFLRLAELERFERDADELTRETARRKVRQQSAQRLDLPDVIDSAHLEDLGLPRHLASARELRGVPLSPGVVTGTARIVDNPRDADDLPDDCILVCRSTDPGWTALFTRIRGLVVERGGVLSHGAITARDFSIPAVACTDATSVIDDGARLRVNGDNGQVSIIEDE